MYERISEAQEQVRDLQQQRKELADRLHHAHASADEKCFERDRMANELEVRVRPKIWMNHRGNRLIEAEKRACEQAASPCTKRCRQDGEHDGQDKGFGEVESEEKYLWMIRRR